MLDREDTRDESRFAWTPNRIAIAALAAVAVIFALIWLIRPASAQDDGPFSWTGLYVGAHAGHGWSNLDLSVNDGFDVPTVFPDTAGISADGWLGGAQIGALYQTGALVFGIEADVSWTQMEGDGFFATQSYIDNDGTDGVSWAETKSIDRFGTVRGRLGFASGKALFYGTAGWAWADVDARHVVAGDVRDQQPIISNVSKTLSGYAVGGGIEWALSPNLSLRSEYLYVNLGRATFAHDVGNQLGNPDLTSADLDMHIVRVGATVRFDPQ